MMLLARTYKLRSGEHAVCGVDEFVDLNVRHGCGDRSSQFWRHHDSLAEHRHVDLLGSRLLGRCGERRTVVQQVPRMRMELEQARLTGHLPAQAAGFDDV